jgi:hypothetical protein
VGGMEDKERNTGGIANPIVIWIPLHSCSVLFQIFVI